jgi:Protein of unknown function (DUF2510)
MESKPPTAGWYPDPSTPDLLRYWDGTQWTHSTAPVASKEKSPASGSPEASAAAGAPESQSANVAPAAQQPEPERAGPHTEPGAVKRPRAWRWIIVVVVLLFAGSLIASPEHECQPFGNASEAVTSILAAVAAAAIWYAVIGGLIHWYRRRKRATTYRDSLLSTSCLVIGGLFVILGGTGFAGQRAQRCGYAGIEQSAMARAAVVRTVL